MEKKRHISKQRFLIAGIFTILIFLLGFAFGMIIDNQIYASESKESEKQKLDYESLQLQYLYLTYLSNKNDSCSALSSALQKTTSELGDSLDKVLSIKEQNLISNPDYLTLYRSYLQSNFKYWLLAKKAKEECDFGPVIILYFFSEEECKICPQQGVILTYFKKKYEENILIFPVNFDLQEEEPFIGLLSSSFKIKALPSLVIEGKLYEGIVSKPELEKILCEKNNNFCE